MDPIEVRIQTEARFNEVLRLKVKDEIKEKIEGIQEVWFEFSSICVKVKTDLSTQAAEEMLRSILMTRFGHLVLPLPPPDPWAD